MLTGGDRANVRFARNSVTTSGASSGYSLAIQAKFGKKTGTVTASEFSDASLQRAVRNAEEIARLSPENPGGDAAPRAADLSRRSRRSSTTRRGATPEWRAGAVRAALDAAQGRRTSMSAGFVETSAQIQAVATSKGLFGFDRFTAADYNLTARTPDGTGSGWASKSFNELRLLAAADAGGRRDRQGGALAQSRRDRARQVHRRARAGGDGRSARQPRRLPPTRVRPMKGAASSRRKAAAPASASRSSARRSRLYSDPVHRAGAGDPVRRRRAFRCKRIDWIDKGVLKNLSYSRYWAQKQGKEATPQPGNLIMDGGNGDDGRSDQGGRARRSWSRASGTSARSIRRRCSSPA